MGGIPWDILFIASCVLLVMGVAGRGLMSPQAAAGALIALLLLRAFARSSWARRRWKGLGHAARWTFAVGLPLGSFVLFAIDYGKGDPSATAAIAGAVGALVLALFGILIMFRGFSSRR